MNFQEKIKKIHKLVERQKKTIPGDNIEESQICVMKTFINRFMGKA
jgi:hypothetical protein